MSVERSSDKRGEELNAAREFSAKVDCSKGRTLTLQAGVFVPLAEFVRKALFDQSHARRTEFYCAAGGCAGQCTNCADEAPAAHEAPGTMSEFVHSDEATRERIGAEVVAGAIARQRSPSIGRSADYHDDLIEECAKACDSYKCDHPGGMIVAEALARKIRKIKFGGSSPSQESPLKECPYCGSKGAHSDSCMGVGKPQFVPSSIRLPTISPDLFDVLVQYDTIVRKGDWDPDPEWDFVMRQADYRLMRDVLRQLPKLIVDPPKPA